MKSTAEKRPKLKPALNRIDIAIEIMALLGLLAIWILPAYSFHSLPENIPSHFGINGQPDSWGSKQGIFFLPLISMVLVLGLSILNRFPHIFNYPVLVTNDNALLLYTRATRIIRILKLSIAVLFFFIEWQICKISNTSGLPGWFLPIVLIIPVLLPVVMAFTLTKIPDSKKTQ